MVRLSRFAFDDPRGPDRLRLDDPFADLDDPGLEIPVASALDPPEGIGEEDDGEPASADDPQRPRQRPAAERRRAA